MADVAVFDYDGQRTMAVLPPLPDDAPPRMREGLARRRMMALGQPCPCGAQPARLSRQERRQLARDRAKGRPGRIFHAYIEHEDGCPAPDDVLLPLIEEWKASQ